MKEDISFDPVEGVSVAIAKSQDNLGQDAWNVYLINTNPFPLDNVLITSKGYGRHEGEDVRTSVLRHMFEQVAPKTFVQVEPIDPGIFHIYNEYWVSYYIGRQIYDKKFIFVPESIVPENLIDISMLNMKGVLHN
ncbi:MAG: hypothetical protein LPJ89_05750 [Hymenobacteraceae bacterium]|nr:hypothetical protein [Hymenobacteraceae bacterium]MDX5394685.1 hypothetical protein [Hymenobacteraceae bacterium]MDX5443274.1 hypothetical protein [Hymenobacteraceae bacterium]MDX5510716.1 hypothetical protein [Hymenobacteraceae bacterium]